MDLQMPEMDGASAFVAIKAAYPDVHILVLTTYDTDADIAAPIEAGADGYVLKQAGREELCAAIRTVARGGSALSPEVAAKVLNRMRGTSDSGLSAREIEVLTALVRGRSNKKIAQDLTSARPPSHLVHIYTKLGVDDRIAAVTTALERGVVRLS